MSPDPPATGPGAGPGSGSRAGGLPGGDARRRGTRSGRPRGAETADRVLVAALDVYADQGLDGFTITAVIAESGISSGSIYHHFGNLDGLCAALYARCMGRLLESLADALDEATTARAGVDALVEGYLRFVRDNRVAAHFVHASSYARFLDAEAAVAVGTAKQPAMDRILGWLRPRIASGQIVDLPESLIEMLVIGPVAETSRRWLAGAPGHDLDQAARLLPERIWRAVQGPSTG